jgi:tRNA-specific 2-thiouridylase
MSGGVDSSVVAALLKKEGHEVVGIHLRLYKDEGDDKSHWLDRSCCKIGLARHVTKQLEIELHVFDIQDDFRDHVILNFKEEYQKGRTPNPCVRCNEHIKFGTLIHKARELGADALATGHYAKAFFDNFNQQYQLLRPTDHSKDQTYFLYRLKQEQLRYILFPLAHKEKKEIYQIAENLDFPYEDVLESQEVCFVNQGDYRSFLKEETPCQVPGGQFVSASGKVLGEHEGIPFYTIGQRKGLGVAFGKRQFVIQIDSGTNQIVLGDEADLYQKEMLVGDLSWVSGKPPANQVAVTVKIRYRFKEAAATILLVSGGKIRVLFDQPQKGAAPGQSAVFYQDDLVLGGGVIE